MIDLDNLDGIDIIDDPNEARTLASEQNSPSESIISSSMSQEDSGLLTCMLITANVGTIFEESTLLELWFQQLKSYLTRVRPQLVAIHCQEVGGKNYETSMKHVNNFTDKIIGDESIIRDYGRVRIFLDENFESLEKFTALGSLYLVHDSVKNVKLYNFATAQYESLEGRKVYADKTTDESAEHVEKVKFPQELFPECRWSRKGFMRTRWLFNDSQPLDLVNIHLFHDASNLVAMEMTPSPYAQNRQRALEFALKRIALPLEPVNNNLPASHQQQQPQSSAINQHSEVPLFIFGDFNFRLDTNKVIQRITEGVRPVVKKKADSNEVVEFIYHKRKVSESGSQSGGGYAEDDKKKVVSETESMRNDDGNSNYIEGGGVVMTVGKKLFDCENLDETFKATENTEWLQELDNELDSFKSQLLEFKISFSPSYPFKEDTSGAHSYMKTRCPAWCDRILFNAAGGNLIHSKQDGSEGGAAAAAAAQQLVGNERIESLQERGDVIYRLMGSGVPMGDHKPVLLYCRLNLAAPHVVDRCTAAATAAASGAQSGYETAPADAGNLIESTAM